MNVEVITKEDLQSFRVQLLEDLKSLLSIIPAREEKKWLRSGEVRKMLKISPGTLQNLRVCGKLHPTKIGGIYYYRTEEITALLSK